jgi:hypothetical protein
VLGQVQVHVQVTRSRYEGKHLRRLIIAGLLFTHTAFAMAAGIPKTTEDVPREGVMVWYASTAMHG